jgi:uncharacterized protein YlxW (UPF0749 family)
LRLVPTESSRSWRFAAPAVLAACGLLLVTSARAADGEDLRGSGYAQLGDLVRAAEERTAELSESVDTLTAEISELTEQQSSDVLEQEQRNLERLQEQAGLTAVAGPALTVTLDDAPRPTGPQVLAPGYMPEDYIVHQQDLEGVINALWVGGAEAMMVMDQRIITTSSVKCVGSVLYLQGKRYGPPYTITAIGDTGTLLAALEASDQVTTYRRHAEQIGLGFDMEIHPDITIPAYEGSLGVSSETAT